MEGNNFMYPVDDVNKIKGAKYRKDMKECVCYYPEDISANPGVEQITEAEYEQYPHCRVNLDKQQLQSDGIDTVTVTVSLPDAFASEQVNLYVDGALVDFAITDANQAVFQLTADNSMAGDILEITAESTHWKMSEKKLLEVV
jgi:hypothetical protein